MQVNWNGVYPAVTTKFTKDFQLDIPAYNKNIDFQIESGVDGIIIGGSLGEASTLTNDERMILLKETIATSSGRVPALINIAERTTTDAIALAQLAEKNGADGLMLLPPMQYKADEYETTVYFKTVAENTSLPIMLYNNPVDYKIAVTIPNAGGFGFGREHPGNQRIFKRYHKRNAPEKCFWRSLQNSLRS